MCSDLIPEQVNSSLLIDCNHTSVLMTRCILSLVDRLVALVILLGNAQLASVYSLGITSQSGVVVRAASF